MSATIQIYEVCENIEFTGNPIMSAFRNLFNCSKSPNEAFKEKYGWDYVDDEHNYDQFSECFADFENSSYMDTMTGQCIQMHHDYDKDPPFSETNPCYTVLNLNEYTGWYSNRHNKKYRASMNQIKKLHKAGLVKRYYFDSSDKTRGVYEYVVLKEAYLNGQCGYRQGWFFTKRWLNSTMPFVICTNERELKDTIDRIIRVKKPRTKIDCRGAEAASYILNTYRELVRQHPEKKYVVEFAF